MTQSKPQTFSDRLAFGVAFARGHSHRLKCWPEFFEAIRLGKKTHDLRRADDRDFMVGDEIVLEEFDPNTKTYSGRRILVEITFITSANQPCALSNKALNSDYCILSIKLKS